MTIYNFFNKYFLNADNITISLEKNYRQEYFLTGKDFQDINKKFIKNTCFSYHVNNWIFNAEQNLLCIDIKEDIN